MSSAELTSLHRPLGTLALIGLALLPLIAAAPARADSFEDEQRQYERVDQAFANQQPRIEARFAELGLAWPPREVFYRVLKRERVIQVWARSDLDSPFEWIRDVEICAISGVPGPKRREGDRQHPEGFYTIDRFNHRSSYHLSLRISYPNDSDDVLSDPDDPGSDIYIHGGCGSSGCLAVTDDGTEWLYVMSVIARSNGQGEIPIHIFPTRFDEAGLAWLREVSIDRELWRFWDGLRPGYDYFETHRLVPTIEVDEAGRYVLGE